MQPDSRKHVSRKTGTIQLTQTQILLENAGSTPKQVIVDLGFRGVNADNPDVSIIHRGKYKSPTKPQRRWLKRRQAVEPTIGNLKSDTEWTTTDCRASWEMSSCCPVCGEMQPALADEGGTPLGAKGYFVALCVASVDQPLPRKA